MEIVALIIFLLVFAVTLVVRELRLFERRDDSALRKPPHPAPEILLEYRNATGFQTQRRIKILGYMQRPRGSSCLFALCNNGTAPRMFRIVSIASLDGEILDTRHFLTETLGVPV